MGVIGNNFRNNFKVNRTLGDVISRTSGNQDRYSSFCNTRSQMGSTEVLARVATPVGGYPSATFYPPQEAGGMALRSVSSSTMTANLIPELQMEVDFTGSGDMEATASLVIAMLCAMTGSGTLSADIVGILNMTLDLTGSGALAADVEGTANMSIDFTGSGDLSADIAAFGDMSIDIVVTGTGLTTSNVGPAVWAAIAALNDIPGSMGEKLNDAGSAANPWTEALPGAYVAGSAGYILGNLLNDIPKSVWNEVMTAYNIPDSFGDQQKKLLTLAYFLGLK